MTRPHVAPEPSLRRFLELHVHPLTRRPALAVLLVVAITTGIPAGTAWASPPNPPSGVSAVPGNASAIVSWSAAPGATGYTVTSSPAHSTRAVAGGATSATLTGLTNGVSYTFRVVASDVDGFSSPSGPSNEVTPATTPDAPTSVTATPFDRSAVVAWEAPSSDGGSPVTGYTVRSEPGGLTVTTGPADRQVVIPDLLNDTAYTFSVTSANERGAGPASAPSPEVTPTSESGAPPAPTTGTDDGSTGGGAGEPAGGSSTTPAESPAPGASPTVSPSSAAGGMYTALAAPKRILDSRNGTGTAAGRKTGPVLLDLASLVPAGATAALFNLTVTNSDRSGFVVVHPEGTSKPATSNVNFAAAQTQANEVLAQLPASRRLVLHVDSTQAHVIADLVGWFSAAEGGRVDVRAPERVLDTRETSSPRRIGEVVLDLSARLPADATSVVLNVTATGADRRGFLVAHPTGAARPGTSNVNFESGQTQANEVMTRVGTGANAGRVSIFVDSARAAVVVDLVAAVVPQPHAGLTLQSLSPARVLDTRSGIGSTVGRKTGRLELVLPSSVPAEAKAVVLNLTATGASASGFLAAYAGPTYPGTSNVNFRPGATQANEVVVAIGPDRKVNLMVGGRGGPQVHLVADLVAALR